MIIRVFRVFVFALLCCGGAACAALDPIFEPSEGCLQVSSDLVLVPEDGVLVTSDRVAFDLDGAVLGDAVTIGPDAKSAELRAWLPRCDDPYTLWGSVEIEGEVPRGGSIDVDWRTMERADELGSDREWHAATLEPSGPGLAGKAPPVVRFPISLSPDEWFGVAIRVILSSDVPSGTPRVGRISVERSCEVEPEGEWDEQEFEDDC